MYARKAGAAAFTVLLSVFSLWLLAAATASAELDDRPRNWWGVEGIATDTSTNVESNIFAIEQVGNTIYVGGKFQTVAPAGGTGTSQPFLAAFHADTGVWIDWWRPAVNGPVYALRASGDGSRLFVGGEFTSIAGVNRAGFAAIDPTTGSVDTAWPTAVGGGSPAVVRAIEISGTNLLVGGAFNFASYNGSQTAFTNVVRMNVNSGVIDTTFKPALTGGGVWGLAQSASYNRVYLTGFFQTVSGVTQRGFAAVNATTGARLGAYQYPYNDDRDDRQYLHDVVTANGNVFVGGSQHQVVVFNEADWSIKWRHVTARYNDEENGGGDTQDLEVWNGRVYVSCHCWGHVFSSVDPIILYANNEWMPPTLSNRRPVKGLYAINAFTGVRVDSFQPELRGTAGPWALQGHTTDGCLWAGGEFTQIDGTSRKNLTRICDEAGPGAAAGAQLTEPGTELVTPLSCWATRVSDTEIRVTWTAATSDNATNYVIRRSRNSGSFYWSGEAAGNATSWNNTGMATGTYTYTVEAKNSTGNSTAQTCGPTSGVTLGATTPPQAITNAVTPLSCWATRVSDTEIRVTWTAATSDNATNYVIRRSRNSGSFYWTGLAGATATSWNNTGMATGTYTYTVEAKNSAGNSTAKTCGPTSGVTLGATTTAAPTTVLSCWATKTADGTIRITWTRATGDNATNFVVHRQRNGGTWYWAAQTGITTSWTNTGVGSGTYAYVVTTKNSSGSSVAKVCGPTGGVTL